MVVELPYFSRTKSVLRVDVPVPVLKLSINVSALYLCLLLVYLTLLWWGWVLTEYSGPRILFYPILRKNLKKLEKTAKILFSLDFGLARAWNVIDHQGIGLMTKGQLIRGGSLINSVFVKSGSF